MKYRFIRYVLAIAMGSVLSLLPHTLTAQQADDEFEPSAPDTLAPMSLDTLDQPLVHHLHLECRGYRDHISVRWGPDDYVALRKGLLHGYLVGRMDKTSHRYDTLATCLKPPTQEEYLARFGETDTTAMAAGELVYGQQPSFDGSLTFNQILDEQQGIFAYLMIICDMRPDVAEAMGLAYTDRTALKGHKYGYSIEPLWNDSTNTYPGIQNDGFQLQDYKAEPYPYAPQDSVQAPSTVQLSWPNIWYSTYDIERRRLYGKSEGEWERLNHLPFLGTPVREDREGRPLNLYFDKGVDVGTYEYRIAGYDLFGDRSLPGPVTRVVMPDLVPPTSPVITSFVILPGDSLLDIHFAKDTLEDDLRGYRPYYYCSDLFGEQWIPMSRELALPTDTVMRVPIRGFLPGKISLASVDRNGNEAYSLPMPFHMPDNIPPQTPQNLRAAVAPDGLVVLFWSPSPDPDVEHYDLYVANDTTHQFLQLPRPASRDTIAYDTLDLTAMQQFRYYQVQAFDYAGNQSPPSPWLQVVRPNFKAPQPCQLDSVWQTDDGLFSRWIPSPEPDIKEYLLQRRFEHDSIWEIIRVLPVDSVRSDHRLWVHDLPRANRSRRYEYCIESINTTGTSSGPSLSAYYRWRGPRTLPVTINFGAAYRPEGVVALAWDARGLREEYREGGFFIIYRRLEGEEDFTELVTLSLDEHSYSNHRFPRGVKAEYRMRYQNENFQYGPWSEIATVHIPKSE